MSRPGVGKRELAVEVAARTGVSQVVAMKVMDAFVEGIKARYRVGERVEIRGFGTFAPATRKARSYRITRLPEAVRSPDRVTLRFKPAPSMVKEVRRGEV